MANLSLSCCDLQSIVWVLSIAEEVKVERGENIYKHFKNRIGRKFLLSLLKVRLLGFVHLAHSANGITRIHSLLKKHFKCIICALFTDEMHKY